PAAVGDLAGDMFAVGAHRELGLDDGGGGAELRVLQEAQVPDVDGHGVRRVAAVVLVAGDFDLKPGAGVVGLPVVGGLPPALGIGGQLVVAGLRGVDADDVGAGDADARGFV